MRLWLKLKRRTGQAESVPSSSNPFSGRGLDKFQQLSAQLAARRDRIVAKTGVPSAMVKFRWSKNSASLVPVIPAQARLAYSLKASTNLSNVTELPSLDPPTLLQKSEFSNLEPPSLLEEANLTDPEIIIAPTEPTACPMESTAKAILFLAQRKLAVRIIHTQKANLVSKSQNLKQLSDAAIAFLTVSAVYQVSNARAVAMKVLFVVIGKAQISAKLMVTAITSLFLVYMRLCKRLCEDGQGNNSPETSSYSSPVPDSSMPSIAIVPQIRIPEIKSKIHSAPASPRIQSAPASPKVQSPSKNSKTKTLTFKSGPQPSKNRTTYEVSSQQKGRRSTRSRLSGTTQTYRSSQPPQILPIMLLIVMASLIWGKIYAILVTSCSWFVVQIILGIKNSRHHRPEEREFGSSSGSYVAAAPATKDYTSPDYRKKVIVEGLLKRNR